MITALTDRLVFRCSQIFCSAISRSLRCFSVYSVHVQLLASHHTDLLHSNQDFALFNLFRFRAMFHASYFVEIWPSPCHFQTWWGEKPFCLLTAWCQLRFDRAVSTRDICS